MESHHVIKVGERTTAEQAIRKLSEALDDVEFVTDVEFVKMVGGRSTVATMSQAAERIVTVRHDVVASVQRHQGATWTFRRTS